MLGSLPHAGLRRRAFAAWLATCGAVLALPVLAQADEAPASLVTVPVSATGDAVALQFPDSVEAAPAAVAPTVPAAAATSRQVGKVTFYAKRHKGRRTASGERYDPSELTMAHRTLPIGSRVRVTNLRNHRSVIVRVNDRGPFLRGRIADLSLAAARQLHMVGAGVVTAAVEPVGANTP